ncbi:hypothetical protein X798_00979 [Onchocerca flexuosa]|uniref:MARVEL domain-containing protein n=1 Tax=Onchocerca flexuosa TaxID=387005 RepID=A0A238C4G9_9BILA|nr:hypothetical protein X798_00979 [Onchocerca flexuosa]
MVEIDKEFVKKWPFGVVMTAQWVGCLILLIILYFSPYYYSGTSFVFFCAWTIFLVGLLTWTVHLFGFQRQILNIGQMSAFIPFALLLCCLFCAAVCGYLAILLYRATPNGLLLNLRTVIIEGDKTSSISTTTATMSPGIYPEGTNPV